jgi:hypothetical protein
MIKIEYPEHDFKIKQENNIRLIFDDVRKLWLKLTPEEWVRQNFIRYLVTVKNYPAALVAMEKKIMVGEMMKRFDILVYNREHRPWMMVECKSMQIDLKEEVLDQVLRYNVGVPVKFLVITNGTNCMAFEKRNMQLVPLNEFPEFE